ncbi:NMCC_0638 family (lipo)protein [Pseudomonas sp. DSP3-2-2]|uniref:NMCC_0638 family (lipo)protein n=1 Tax=unclassified Pseudomonas TaxID=196821 RepID=UPI003CEB8FA9
MEAKRARFDYRPQKLFQPIVHALPNQLVSDAWPVPDKYGTFVLALPGGKNFCAVHVRKANTETATKLFTALVANAPAALIVRQVKNEQAKTASNGQIQTVSYEWSVPNATRKMLFTLTTASSESAQLQVLGSAAIIDQ